MDDGPLISRLDRVARAENPTRSSSSSMRRRTDAKSGRVDKCAVRKIHARARAHTRLKAFFSSSDLNPDSIISESEASKRARESELLRPRVTHTRARAHLSFRRDLRIARAIARVRSAKNRPTSVEKYGASERYEQIARGTARGH